MTGAELERMRKIFYPKSVAVLGANDSPDKVGYNLLESVLYGGFKGKVYPVHPRYETLLGLKVYPSVEDIPERVDLALVGLNQHATVEAVERCGRLGVQGAVCVAGGFRETGDEGLLLEKRLKEISLKYGIKVIGPNTLGMINTEGCLDASFYPLRLPGGCVSFITQSGGIGLNIIQKSVDEGVGINKWVGVGNRTVLEIADYLEYFAGDPGTKVIGIFLEGVDDARRLVQAAARAARHKPVVVYKVGRSDAVNYAAATHTGSIAGSHQLFRDVFRQFGILMVDSVPELVAACKALSLCPVPGGGRAGMYTYTAGPSIAALDQLARRGIEVPALRQETIRKIKGILGENPPVILKNPLDAAGLGFAAENYGLLAEAVLEDPDVDLLVTFSCAQKNWRNPTRELIAARRKSGKPVLACYISTVQGVAGDRKELQEAGVPLYTSPDEAAWGAAALVHYGGINSQTITMTGPNPSLSPTGDSSLRISGLIAKARAEGREYLLEDESKEILAARGIPVAPCSVAGTEDEVVLLAEKIGYPVVLKVRSPEIVHKSDCGGVHLNLAAADQVRAAYREIINKAAAIDPEAAVTVQPMAPRGAEVLIGVTSDRQFGPVVAFGLGGIFTEILKDVSFRMAPVEPVEAGRMIEQIKGNRLLRGYRGLPAVDTALLTGIISEVSRLAAEFNDIAEMDLNPVAVYPEGALVLDARVVLKKRV